MFDPLYTKHQTFLTRINPKHPRSCVFNFLLTRLVYLAFIFTKTKFNLSFSVITHHNNKSLAPLRLYKHTFCLKTQVFILTRVIAKVIWIYDLLFYMSRYYIATLKSLCVKQVARFLNCLNGCHKRHCQSEITLYQCQKLLLWHCFAGLLFYNIKNSDYINKQFNWSILVFLKKCNKKHCEFVLQYMHPFFDKMMTTQYSCIYCSTNWYQGL